MASIGQCRSTRHCAARGVDSLVKSLLDNGIAPNSNVYAELGSTWRLVMRDPTQAAHTLGKLLRYVGEKRVLWGTDAIWYGTPQWQIEAFRRFQIPESLVERHKFQPLTREVKEQIFGLTAARLFGLDVRATRAAVPKDAVGRLRMSYLEEGPAPSHRLYGWIAN